MPIGRKRGRTPTTGTAYGDGCSYQQYRADEHRVDKSDVIPTSSTQYSRHRDDQSAGRYTQVLAEQSADEHPADRLSEIPNEMQMRQEIFEYMDIHL